jgi:hypothetical protein
MRVSRVASSNRPDHPSPPQGYISYQAQAERPQAKIEPDQKLLKRAILPGGPGCQAAPFAGERPPAAAHVAALKP